MKLNYAEVKQHRQEERQKCLAKYRGEYQNFSDTISRLLQTKQHAKVIMFIIIKSEEAR